MKATPLDFVLCGAFITVLVCVSVLGVMYGVHPLSTAGLGDYYVVADCLAFLLIYGIASGLLIRLMLKLRQLEAGEFEMDSANFIYWKLLVMICDFGQRAMHPFSPIFLRPVIASLYGATVGKNVAVDGVLGDTFMISLGDNVVIGHDAVVATNVTNHGKITFGRVKIGHDVTLGMNVVVFPDVEIGDSVVVAINSVVMQGSRIPAGETWRGNPARKWQ